MTRPGSPAAWRSTAWITRPRRIGSAAPARVGQLALHVPARVARGDLPSPIVLLLATGQPELQLRLAAREVQPERDQRQALRLGLAQELVDLRAMEEQLAGAFRLVVVAVAGVPRRDVHADQPGLAVLDARVGIGQADLPVPDALDLGPGQHDASLEGLFDAELVSSSSVE